MAIKQNEKYDATHIQVLEGAEAVRKRPAMYIGDTGSAGLHHLVYEVVDNSIDEAMAGYCSEITVVIHADNSVTVEDNGRGIPVDMHAKEKKPAVEVALTTLHAGGKFDHRSYKVSGGLHGVGVSCVNALSEWLEVEVRRDSKIYHQRYKRGKTDTKLTVIGKSKGTGTKISFKPDKEIFGAKYSYSFETLSNRLRELAFLNKELKVDSSYESSIQLVGRIDQDASEFYKYYQKSENRLINLPIKFMSKLTKRILGSIDYKDVQVKRERNFDILHRELKKYNKLKIEIEDMSTPLIYPFMSEDKTLRDKLIANKIYVAQYWCEVLKRKKLTDIEKLFVNQIIPLPVDQRYNSEDMHRILKVIIGS